LTALGRLEDRLGAFSSRFQIYLVKPVEPKELIAVVTSLGKAGARR